MADLATLLETEAQAEIESILAEARVKAEATVQAASAQAQGLVEAHRRSLENEFAAGLTRARSAANLESSALRLSGSFSSTERAFAQAEAELRAYTRTAEYGQTLVKLITEARAALGQVSRLEVNPADLTVASAAARAAGLEVPVTASPEVETGVRAYAATGRTAITNTLLGRLARARDSLSGEVTRLLSPTPPGQG